MGKPKRPDAHRRVVHKVHTSPRSPNSDDSIDKLISKAQSCANEFDLRKSLQYYDRALRLCEEQVSSDSIHPRRIELLQTSAYTLLELGEKQKAKKRLLQIISLTKEPSYQNFMYLAQLSEGQESLQYYRKGLDALHRESSQATSSITGTSSSASSPTEFQSLGRAESNAWCAIAELYMTDLCDQSDAQTECERAFQAAIQVEPMNPQAWLTAADYYTVTENEQAARDSIQRCLDLWWSKLESFLADSSTKRVNQPVKEEDQLTTTEAPGDVMMSTGKFPEAVQTKIGNKEGEKMSLQEEEEDIQLDMEELTGINSSGLLSLSRMMIRWEMWEKCATLLEALLEEDEDNVEVHYLLTEVGRHLWKEDDPQLLRYHALQTKIMAAKLGDMELVEDMGKLLLELPEDEEAKSDESDSIPSTDDDDDNEKEDLKENKLGAK